MSFVPITTQLCVPNSTLVPQVTAVLVHTETMTVLQSSLMKESRDLLSKYLLTMNIKANDLEKLPPEMKWFVIPCKKKSLIEKIRARYKKSLLYLPRAVIEARRLLEVGLPIRHLVISLTMSNCKIFPVKTLDKIDLRNKIFRMSGQIVDEFDSSDLNVVITDRADHRYCARAHKKKKPVVSRDWVRENYRIAKGENQSEFGHDAMSTVEQYRIKPFFGLHFKINDGIPISDVKQLITENQGSIIHGDEKEKLTHIVVLSKQDIPKKRLDKLKDGYKDKPKIVDIDFLRLCVKSGHYLKKPKKLKSKSSSDTIVKEEPNSQVISQLVENNTPPSDGLLSEDESQTMLPPPTRPLRQQQPDNIMDDMIRKAMSTIESAQTQQASTQMRRLPDPELRIEQTFEPSQLLYWTDKRV